MTTSVKEALYSTVERLSEAECQQILEFIQYLQHSIPPTLKRLTDDSTFNIPSKGFGVFQAVDPIQGEGIPASRLLTEDRR